MIFFLTPTSEYTVIRLKAGTLQEEFCNLLPSCGYKMQVKPLHLHLLTRVFKVSTRDLRTRTNIYIYIFSLFSSIMIQQFGFNFWLIIMHYWSS